MNDVDDGDECTPAVASTEIGINDPGGLCQVGRSLESGTEISRILSWPEPDPEFSQKEDAEETTLFVVIIVRRIMSR